MDDLIDWADVAALKVFAIHLREHFGDTHPVKEAIDWTSRPGEDLDLCNYIACAIREAYNANCVELEKVRCRLDYLELRNKLADEISAKQLQRGFWLDVEFEAIIKANKMMKEKKDIKSGYAPAVSYRSVPGGINTERDIMNESLPGHRVMVVRPKK